MTDRYQMTQEEKDAWQEALDHPRATQWKARKRILPGMKEAAGIARRDCQELRLTWRQARSELKDLAYHLGFMAGIPLFWIFSMMAPRFFIRQAHKQALHRLEEANALDRRLYNRVERHAFSEEE
jgi:hypothetical protein